MFTARRTHTFTESVIREMTRIANLHEAVNLAQGFPDFPMPEPMKDAACTAIHGDVNQYAVTWGSPALRLAIAEKYRRWYGMEVDPDREVTVTCGATEAMISAMLALADPGDEVVIFEPFYENYGPDAVLAGATPVFVPLRAPDWRIDEERLAAALARRPKAIVLNTPHNPTGKVFTREELDLVAEVVLTAGLLLVTDEVYEHLVFDGAAHVSPATLPGLRERTLVVGSGGKTFSTTGWKVGWTCGPAPLVAAVRTAKQFLTYVNAGPFQPAIAAGLALPDAYFAGIARDLEYRRDVLVQGLRAAGLPVVSPQSTYFAVVDVRPVQPDGDGLAFCRALPGRAGVVAVPLGGFYAPQDEHLGRHLVRFAFCKRDDVLAEAVQRLSRMAA